MAENKNKDAGIFLATVMLGQGLCSFWQYAVYANIREEASSDSRVHSGQLSLAIPPWVGAMSTSKSWGINKHTARCASPYPWSLSVNWLSMGLKVRERF